MYFRDGTGACNAYYQAALPACFFIFQNHLMGTCSHAPKAANQWRTELPQHGTTLDLVRFALHIWVIGPIETLLRRWNTWASQLLDGQLDELGHQPQVQAGCHQNQEGASALSRLAAAADPTWTRRRLLNLYHGSKAAPFCQQDTFTQGGQVRQAGAGDSIRHLVILFQAPVSF